MMYLSAVLVIVASITVAKPFKHVH